MKIEVGEPSEKSKSRKVNKMVQLQLEVAALTTATDVRRDLITVLYGSLTGGQMAEAQGITERTLSGLS